MPRLRDKIKPKSGFAHVFHIFLLCLLPAIIFVLIRMHFVTLAFVVVLLSKWRMLAVRPRYWLAHIRANAVDIIVGLSVVIFMDNSGSAKWQLIWAVLYGLWQIFIKPGTGIIKVSLQASIGQLAGLMAMFIVWPEGELLRFVIVSWLICYMAARHFLMIFDEQYASLLAHIWAYFVAALVWLLSHWLLFYGLLAQPTLLISIIGYSAAAIYILDHTEKLSVFWRRQFIFIMVAMVTIILVFSDWGDKAV